MRRLGQVLVALGSLMAIGSAWMHANFARPVVIGRLPAATDAETLSGIHAAWIAGSSAIAAFGVLGLLMIPALGREKRATFAVLLAGLWFLAYGGWAYFVRHHSHFVGFLGVGVLMTAGSLLASKDSGRA